MDIREKLSFEEMYPFIMKRLHYIWLIMAFPIGFTFVFLTPPFQVPDEVAHFIRASQTSIGVFYGRKPPGERSGGDVPLSALALTRIKGFHELAFHTESRTDIVGATGKGISSIAWDGQTGFVPNPASIIYPPTSYVIAAIGLRLARLLSWNVLSSFYFARLLNLLACLFASFFAIRLATRGKCFLAMILSMPMTLFLFASVSQDALLIAFAALGTAILSRLLDQPFSGKKNDVLQLVAVFFCLTLLCVGRPPYVPLLLVSAFLILVHRVADTRTTLLLASFSTILVIGWSIAVAPLMVALRPGTDPSLQMHTILTNPLQFIGTLAKTVWICRIDWAITFIGVLGWLNLHLTRVSYHAYEIVLVITSILGITFYFKDYRLSQFSFAAVLFGLIISCILIVGIQYISWTRIDSPVAEGVQGRYFIPLACYASIIMKDKALAWPGGVFMSALLVVVCCAIVWFVGVGSMFAMIGRYYY